MLGPGPTGATHQQCALRLHQDYAASLPYASSTLASHRSGRSQMQGRSQQASTAETGRVLCLDLQKLREPPAPRETLHLLLFSVPVAKPTEPTFKQLCVLFGYQPLPWLTMMPGSLLYLTSHYNGGNALFPWDRHCDSHFLHMISSTIPTPQLLKAWGRNHLSWFYGYRNRVLPEVTGPLSGRAGPQSSRTSFYSKVLFGCWACLQIPLLGA